MELPGGPALTLIYISEWVVMVRVTITVMKCHDQGSWGVKDLFYTSTSQSVTRGSQDRNSNRTGTWTQELKQRPWIGATCWFAPYCLFSLLTHRIQDQQHRMDWVLPHWLIT